MQNVARRVFVPVQDQPALWAGMRALAQRLLHEFAAGRAQLGRVAGIHQHDPLPSFFRFGEGHLNELAPRYIQDALAHPTTFAHLHWGQIFKHDELIGIHQGATGLDDPGSCVIRDA